jgi:hypothetical protein
MPESFIITPQDLSEPYEWGGLFLGHDHRRPPRRNRLDRQIEEHTWRSRQKL